MTQKYYAKTDKIHKLVYAENGMHILECGGVSEGGSIHVNIKNFNKCQVCFYDEFND